MLELTVLNKRGRREFSWRTEGEESSVVERGHTRRECFFREQREKRVGWWRGDTLGSRTSGNEWEVIPLPSCMSLDTYIGYGYLKSEPLV